MSLAIAIIAINHMGSLNSWRVALSLIRKEALPPIHDPFYQPVQGKEIAFWEPEEKLSQENWFMMGEREGCTSLKKGERGVVCVEKVIQDTVLVKWKLN